MVAEEFLNLFVALQKRAQQVAKFREPTAFWG